METKQIFDTLEKIFEKRNYIFKEEKQEISLKKSRTVRYYEKSGNPHETLNESQNALVKVYFYIFEKFDTDRQKEIFKNLENDIKHVIVVYNNLTNLKFLSVLSNRVEFECFKQDNLSFDITTHVLFPKKCEKLTETQVEDFKSKFKIQNFPCLLSTDPMVLFYNYKKGDIIRIVRENNEIVYRYVK